MLLTAFYIFHKNLSKFFYYDLLTIFLKLLVKKKIKVKLFEIKLKLKVVWNLQIIHKRILLTYAYISKIY